jgi:hypothetical protein
MMISPGYSYAKAPDQDHFLSRRRSQSLFQRILDAAPAQWKFNQSPVFLEFLKGDWDLECRPWGTPTYNLFGWQRPCYLLDEGYAKTFRELMEETDWDAYGRSSGNAKCQDCMVHCGYEPAAVEATFGSLRGLLGTARLMLFGPPRGTPVPQQDMPARRPAPGLALQPNGLPALPILDRVA